MRYNFDKYGRRYRKFFKEFGRDTVFYPSNDGWDKPDVPVALPAVEDVADAGNGRCIITMSTGRRITVLASVELVLRDVIAFRLRPKKEEEEDEER